MQIISGVFIGTALVYSIYQFYTYCKSKKNIRLNEFGRGQTKENSAKGTNDEKHLKIK